MKRICAVLTVVLLAVAFLCRADDLGDLAATQALSAHDLEVLVAPYALYPDALVAQILPAAGYPREVSLAAHWVRAHPHSGPGEFELQPWDSSVRAIARFPVVVQALDENVDATIALGNAFVYQQQDLMEAIQRLRARFRGEGVLVTNRWHRVLVDGEIIQIMPAEAGLIYVPSYTPEIDYDEARLFISSGPLTFCCEMAIGPWLDLDFDWHRHCVFFGHFGKRGEWEGRGGKIWSHPNFEWRHFDVDIRKMKNVRLRNEENFIGRNINNTPRPKALVARPLKNAGRENVTRKPEAVREGGASLGAYGRQPVANQQSVRGQKSLAAAHQAVAAPNNAERRTEAPVRETHVSARPVHVSEPAPQREASETFRVGNGGEARMESSRGEASRSSMGASSGRDNRR